MPNLLNLYLPIAESGGTWKLYDNSGPVGMVFAHGGENRPRVVVKPATWKLFLERANEAEEPRDDDDG